MNQASWSSLLNQIAAKEKELGSPELLWYRGVTSNAHTLVPSLFRYGQGAAREREVFARYRRFASRSSPQRQSDWELLFDMQHYGVPTRLLDWSEVMGIALYFASLGPETANSAIYILDPHALNRAASREGIPHLTEDEDLNYQKILKNEPFKMEKPLAVAPPLQNPRMFAQRACFTLHGDSCNPLERLVPEAVRKVDMTPTMRSSAKAFLRLAGLADESIFPDSAGLARTLHHFVAH